uniref:hypothetical protein n=1 Tax=Staphylococcus epidermidis TaxID=1282 RepID=UPI0016426937
LEGIFVVIEYGGCELEECEVKEEILICVEKFVVDVVLILELGLGVEVIIFEVIKDNVLELDEFVGVIILFFVEE